jgi:hypothetical protein
LEAEQIYYLKRYLAEIGEDARLEFCFDKLSERGQTLISNQSRIFEVKFNTCYNALNTNQMGNVSDKSRRFHEDHIGAMIQGTAAIWSASILRCDDATLTYFRTHHPVQEIRTWCNIVLGLSALCRSDLNSGHDALHERYTELMRERKTKVSAHQRELGLALKLMVLACRDDNYAYGVQYCHKMMATGKRSLLSMNRVLKVYRLISYLFEEIHEMIGRGSICIRNLQAIANEIEVREVARYKYVRKVKEAPTLPDTDITFDLITSSSMEALFQGLELYATELTDKAIESAKLGNFESAMVEAELKFDLNIGDQVDMMIRQLNLQPSGPRGIIDLGDDDILEFDEW